MNDRKSHTIRLPRKSNRGNNRNLGAGPWMSDRDTLTCFAYQLDSDESMNIDESYTFAVEFIPIFEILSFLANLSEHPIDQKKPVLNEVDGRTQIRLSASESKFLLALSWLSNNSRYLFHQKKQHPLIELAFQSVENIRGYKSKNYLKTIDRDHGIILTEELKKFRDESSKKPFKAKIADFNRPELKNRKSAIDHIDNCFSTHDELFILSLSLFYKLKCYSKCDHESTVRRLIRDRSNFTKNLGLEFAQDLVGWISKIDFTLNDCFTLNFVILLTPFVLSGDTSHFAIKQIKDTIEQIWTQTTTGGDGIFDSHFWERRRKLRIEFDQDLFQAFGLIRKNENKKRAYLRRLIWYLMVPTFYRKPALAARHRLFARSKSPDIHQQAAK